MLLQRALRSVLAPWRKRARRTNAITAVGSVAALLAIGSTLPAWAQDAYPRSPIKVLVGYAPGGSVDAMARVVAEEMGARLGQTLAVNNREGAAAALAMQALATAAPDGYTIAFGPAGPITMALHTSKGLGYRPESFAYVCQVFRNEFVVAVSASSATKTVADLVRTLKSAPEPLKYGHAGRASANHLAMEMMLRGIDAKAVDVPYRGEAALLPPLLAGDLDFASFTLFTANTHKERVRTLAILSDTRNPSLPDVPTAAEAGLQVPPFYGFNGIYAPQGTPPERLMALQRACEHAASTERVKAAARTLGVRVAYMPGSEFGRVVVEEHKRLGPLLATLPLQ